MATACLKFLDADGDGFLASRELRTATAHLEAAACLSEEVLNLERLPRQSRMIISQGHPQNLLASPQRNGPEWFRSMDRNSDGDVSIREFVGPAPAFRKLDRDADGLLDASELPPPAK